ncbi:MAG: hypothetical protein EB084_14925 [Proteobacteria bacterium]|nr:hypothetical protein [Pseudomonadota bacterium]
MRTLLTLLICCLLTLALNGCGAGGGGGASSGPSSTPSALTTDATSPVATSTPLSTSLTLGGTTTLPPVSSPTPSPTSGGTSFTGSLASPLYVAIYTHCEDKHHPATPDFSTDKASYITFRNAIIAFANAMHARNLSWNWQSDYNFLEACKTYEVQQADATLLASTGGMNVVQWLHDTSGAEIDPHSHEADGYNYADVAYLITQCGVTPAPVVGGHIYSPTDAHYQNWPKFIGGLQGSRYPQYTFTPNLLMGAGSSNHMSDAVVSGMWRPASASSYFTDDPNGAIASFGTWDNDISKISDLLTLMSNGTLSPSLMWTAGYVFNQSDMTTAGYIDNTIVPQLDTLVSLRDQGAVQLVRFTEATATWQTQYGAQGSVHQ